MNDFNTPSRLQLLPVKVMSESVFGPSALVRIVRGPTNGAVVVATCPGKLVLSP